MLGTETYIVWNKTITREMKIVFFFLDAVDIKGNILMFYVFYSKRAMNHTLYAPQ